MIQGRDIIFISSIEWDFLWQHAQEIASRLARAGNLVLYIENTGVRSPGIRDAGRVAQRLKLWTSSLRSHGVREVQPNLYVCSPLVLPPFGPGWRRQINRRLLLPLIRRTARTLGMRDPVLWTHLPTDTALDIIELLQTHRNTVVYYCIADFSQLTPHVAQLQKSEKAIIQLSDVVFANSLPLAVHCKQWNDNVHIFPPGLNLSAFPSEELASEVVAGHKTGESKGLIDQISHEQSSEAVIGYVGGLHRHVDVDLLQTMARSKPHWLWVFVGSVQTTLGELGTLPNVVLLGQRPHTELVRHIRSFDVCIVPYLINRETLTIVPVKINEYLAAGKPVVSTELPAVQDFNRQHKVLVTVAGEAKSFLEAIEQQLKSPNGKAVTTHRREVAALHDWDARIEAMCQLIEAESEAKSQLLKSKPDRRQYAVTARQSQ
jgi:glycosyltransferase involved in cell wall biosynthesis